MKSGEYFELTLEKSGTDLELSLIQPDGQSIRSASCSTEGPVRISEIAQKQGNYVLSVRPCDVQGQEPPTYKLLLSQPRIATRTDRFRVDAEHLSAEADSLVSEYREASTRKAILKYNAAIQSWTASGDSGQQTKSLNTLSRLYRELGDLKQSEVYAEQALAEAKRSHNSKGIAQSNLSLALISAIQGSSERPMEYCSDSLRIAGEVSDRMLEAEVQQTLVTIYYFYRADYEKAAALAETVEAAWDEMGNRIGQAKALAFRAAIDFDRSRFVTGPELARQALSTFRSLGDKRDEVQALILIGYHEALLGNPQKAMNTFKEAEPLVIGSGDLDWEVAWLNQVATIYRDLGQSDTALQLFEKALDNEQRHGSFGGIADNLWLVGRGYFDTGNVPQALIYLNKAINSFHTLKNKRSEALALEYLGAAYEKQGDIPRAREAFSMLHQLAIDVADRRLQAAALTGTGHIFESAGDPTNALEYYRNGYDLRRATLDPIGEVSILYQIAHAQQSIEDFNGQFSSSSEAIKIIEGMRSTVASSELRSSYFASMRQPYELRIDALMQLYKRTGTESLEIDAFDTSERSRARTLLDHIGETRDALLAGVDPKQLERQVSLRAQLNSKKEKYNGAPVADRGKLLDEIQELNRQDEELQAQILVRSPHYASLIQPEPLKFSQIRDQLDRDTLMLEFALGRERSYVFVLDRESITSYMIPGELEIEKAVRRLRELLTTRQVTQSQRSIRAADEEFSRAASELSWMLLGKAADRLPGRRLIIIADGILQSLPFNALPTPTPNPDSAGNLLIQNHVIVSLPSASSLAQLRIEAARKRTPDRLLAVFGDPIFQITDARIPRVQTPAPKPASSPSATSRSTQSPRATSILRGGTEGILSADLSRLEGTRNEALAILGMVPKELRMEALGFDANKAAVLSPELSRYRFIHFATHTIMNDAYPDLSSMVFSLFDERGKSQDGYLWLKDMYNLKLSADLVVLSACDTGLGKEVKGEGLMSMVRGFMYSGTPRVLASLWKVDDVATAELMTEFYKQLLENNQTPADALHLAQIVQRTKPGRVSPYYWAGFQIHGEWR
jgi:CHAT domain-containing protein/tetratricopeptide (TPR) repeat protein